jgi:tRNA pseudouridine55 synthase
MTAEDYLNGQLILIDKPLNWTSFQVVNKVRWLLKHNYGLKKLKVGHAGTLDPLASGLLVICTGKFTKKIEEYQGQEKEYTGTITLGATTPSYDLETAIDREFDISHVDDRAVEEARKKFIGEIQQQPPVFSALKKEGKRLYDYAREGKDVEIPTRTVVISAFEITGFSKPEVHFRVLCSKGTYIRSLAHDFGKAVGAGGHLSGLRRTRIGAFRVEDAMGIEEFEAGLAR